MNWADALNGTFELLGGFAIILSIVKLHRDKMVRGVSWLHTSFFALWGFWNLYYYPSLDQWLSFSGGIFITTTNTIWVLMLIYYTRLERRNTNGTTLGSPL